MSGSNYIGFGPRVLAWGVDKALFALILAALVAGLQLPSGSPLDLARRLIAADAPPMLVVLLAQRALLEQILLRWLLPLLAIIALLRWKRATPGKMLIGAEVVDATSGASMGWWQASVRSLACTVSLLSCGLGYAWVLFDKRKQAWHDKIAGTVVVRKRNTGAARKR